MRIVMLTMKGWSEKTFRYDHLILIKNFNKFLFHNLDGLCFWGQHDDALLWIGCPFLWIFDSPIGRS